MRTSSLSAGPPLSSRTKPVVSADSKPSLKSQDKPANPATPIADLFLSKINPQARRASGEVDQAPFIDQGYYTPDEVVSTLQQMAADFPALATAVALNEVLGTPKTEEGRSIWALRLTRESVPTPTPKRVIVFALNHHARELNTTFTGIEILRQLLKDAGSDPAIQNLLETSTLFVIPTMNPDGLNRVWTGDNMWRKNRHKNADGSLGVDQNRNYPALFGREGSSTNPNSDIYRGTGPASEPESKTLIELANVFCPEIYIDIHSSGQEVLDLYPSSAKVSAPIKALGQRYAQQLQEKSGYGSRPPSGSGEAPHEMWMNHGAMSFLMEIGRQFQPPMSEAKAEVPRVWAAVRHAFTTWKPAVRGSVKEAGTNLPVQATFSFEKGLFLEGETVHSRAYDGAFHLWLPPGKHEVTVSAEGFVSKTFPVEVKDYDQPLSLPIELNRQRAAMA